MCLKYPVYFWVVRHHQRGQRQGRLHLPKKIWMIITVMMMLLLIRMMIMLFGDYDITIERGRGGGMIMKRSIFIIITTVDCVRIEFGRESSTKLFFWMGLPLVLQRIFFTFQLLQQHHQHSTCDCDIIMLFSYIVDYYCEKRNRYVTKIQKRRKK